MMNGEGYKDVQKRMQSLDDVSLIRLVHLSHDEYKPEALSIAQEELHIRSLDKVTPEQLAQRSPDKYYPYVPEFCPQCIAETTDESLKGYFTINGIGLRLLGSRSKCDICGSVIQRLWFCFVIPIFPISKYRVKYLGESSLHTENMSRRLRELY